MMGLAGLLFKLSARGSLRIGFAITVIALFTSLITSVSVVSYSYYSQTPVFKKIGRDADLYVTDIPVASSVEVNLAFIEIGSSLVAVIAPSDISRYLNIIGVSYEGEPPKKGQALVGNNVKDIIGSGSLPIKGTILDASGYIRSPGYLSYSIIVDPTTFSQLALTSSRLHFGEEPAENAIVLAPSIMKFVEGIIDETAFPLESVNIFVYVLLVLSLVSLGYIVPLEGERSLKVLMGLSTPLGRILVSFGLLSLVVSVLGVALGFFLGVFASASFSTMVSLLLKINHVKIIAGYSLLYPLLVSILLSAASLAAGFSYGYVKHFARNKNT